MRGKLVLSLIVLTILAGFIGFYYFQKGSFSKDVLKLEILGPEKADLLEEVDYIVRYKNNGNVKLENPELIFEFPSHSLPEDGSSLRRILTSDKLGGAIYPGQEKVFHFKARLLGKEGETVQARAILTYKPKNLKALYRSETTFATQIKKVPLTFEIDLPSKIESGKEFRFNLNYFSNVDYPLSNLRCQIDYPSDFKFLESEPKGLTNNEWQIGLLNKAEGGRIQIRGKVLGEVGREEIFQARLGSFQRGEFILLKEITRGIAIIKPSIYITQQINGNPQYIASPGDWLHYEIFFRNVGEEGLSNLVLVSKLKGQAFDFQTLKSDQGNYEPGDNSIIFDWRRVLKLQYLPPMEEGKVDFWIKLKDEFPVSKNPLLENKVFLSQVKESFTTKINSKLVVIQKGYFEDEIFGNSGPIPPEVNQPTTYTITWQVKNYYNKVKDVKVRATLPQNVKLTGKIFPEEEAKKFSFDSKSREIVWSVGEMEVGQGIINPAPNISFQVVLTPTPSQKGQTPEIISSAKITGEDEWTKQMLEAEAEPIDTTLPDDETVKDGIVQ